MVKAKATKRKVRRKKKGKSGSRWTPAEDTLLTQLYQRGGYSLALERFPKQYRHRSAKSVACRAERLGLSGRNLDYFNHQQRRVIKTICVTEMAFALQMNSSQFVRDVIPRLPTAFKRGKLWAVPLSDWEAYLAQRPQYPSALPLGFISSRHCCEVLGVKWKRAKEILVAQDVPSCFYRQDGRGMVLRAYREREVYEIARGRRLASGGQRRAAA